MARSAKTSDALGLGACRTFSAWSTQLLSLERHNTHKTQVFQEGRSKMTRENSLLRSLLILRGLTETEIEGYLRSQRQPTNSSSQGQLKVTPVAAKSRPPTSQRHALVDGHYLPMRSSKMEPGSPEMISSVSNPVSDRTAVSPKPQDRMQSNRRNQGCPHGHS
uniref:ArsX n=1 Tax=Byssochlamys spectabilis TaxID=264951 RepID=A0A7M4CBU4_BYSSP|nr:ArsX [Paecilomyces variotii]